MSPKTNRLKIIANKQLQLSRNARTVNLFFNATQGFYDNSKNPRVAVSRIGQGNRLRVNHNITDRRPSMAGHDLNHQGASMTEDVLDMVYINSLPQPFIGRGLDGYEWPMVDFDVSTGLVRIDVCGLLQVKSIVDFVSFRDDYGVEHSALGLYADAIPEEREPIAQPVPQKDQS